MVVALLVMLLITGVIALTSFSSATRRADERSDRSRVQSEVVLMAAANDLSARLERWEVGRNTKYVSISNTATKYAFMGLSTAGPFPITDPISGKKMGEYLLLAPRSGSGYCSGATCRAGGYLNFNPASPERGTVSFFVEAYGFAGKERRAERGRLVFKRSSLAQYAVLSDQPIDVGGMGTSMLPAGSAIHSNNVENNPTAVRLSNVNYSQARRITSRSGGLAGCTDATRCTTTGKVIPFSSVDVAFNQVLKHTAQCGTSPACVVRENQLPASGTRYPLFVVTLSGDCAIVSTSSYQTRFGMNYPVLDDASAMGSTSYRTRYCPPAGGGALLLEGDVQVQGTLRAQSFPKPLTIMARRPNSPTRKVTVAGKAYTLSEPAAIYMQSSGGAFGGRQSNGTTLPAPLGLVAQGGVYIPTDSIDGTNRSISVDAAAIVAGGGSFSVGPTFMSHASEDYSSTSRQAYTLGGGLTACSAPNSVMPSGNSFVFNGTVASRHRTFFSYSTGGCSRGYSYRSIRFDTMLGWYPMPYFPALDPWHLVDWQEYNGA